MLKRYFSLDEARAYIVERQGITLSETDFFDIIVSQKLTLCFWYSGNLGLIDVIDPLFPIWGKIRSVLDFHGYLAPVNASPVALRKLITSSDEFECLDIEEVRIVDDIDAAIPPLDEKTAHVIWGDFATLSLFQGADYYSAKKEAADAAQFVTSAYVCQRNFLIPKAEIDSLLAKANAERAPADRQSQPAATEPGKSRNWPLIAGALLDLLTSDGRRNQTGIITELADRKIWGLGSRTLDDAFAEAKRAYAEKQKE